METVNNTLDIKIVHDTLEKLLRDKLLKNVLR